jgi:hypothetical protein
MGNSAPAPTESRPTLLVGGETYFIDAHPEGEDPRPLPVRAPTLRPRGDDCLILAPPRRLYLLVVIAAFTVGVVYFVAEQFAARPDRPLWLLLALLPLIALKAYADWLRTCYRQEVRFDRAAGRVNFARGDGGRPLDTIVAVQILPAGAEAAGSQLNLILNDLNLPTTSARTLPRRRLAQARDRSGLLAMARRLAEFLGVPLLDQPATDEPRSTTASPP